MSDFVTVPILGPYLVAQKLSYTNDQVDSFKTAPLPMWPRLNINSNIPSLGD